MNKPTPQKIKGPVVLPRLFKQINKLKDIYPELYRYLTRKPTKEEKEVLMEMTYKFYLDTDRYVSLRLPVPFKELKKREQNKVIKWAKESVDAVYHKSRIEAQGLRDAYLKKAKELEEKYALKNGGTYEHQEKGN